MRRITRIQTGIGLPLGRSGMPRWLDSFESKAQREWTVSEKYDRLVWKRMSSKWGKYERGSRSIIRVSRI